ncbi:hypothetical protein Tco_0735774 [Tanacetum coccineum]
MNYKPFVTWNQSNGSAGTKACDDAGEDEKKVTKEPGKEGGNSSNDQENDDNIKSTNNINTISDGNNINNVNAVSSTANAAGIEDNDVDKNIVYGCADDPNMPHLKEISKFSDNEDVGAETDMNNLDTFMSVSPIPITRIHKDHLVEQIIGDLNSAPQTRRMTKNLKEHGLFSLVQKRTNHKDFQNCLFACFLSQKESKKVAFRHFRDAFSVVFGLSLTQDTVMSDSEDSTVTYTVVSSPFGVLSDIGSSGVDGPPMMPEDPYAYVVAAFQALPSPDYVLGPEYPPSPKFVPESVYLEFMPPEDEILPAEEQPLPVVVSLTTDSPGYVPESDSEEDPEEDDDEDLEEDHADYLADGGDDGDDDDESSDDDEDDDVDIKGDEEEGEEHPAPADSTAGTLPVVDHAPSAEETEPFETDELLAIPTPPPSPLSLWSSPLPQIPSPPLPVSSPVPVSSPPPASPICPLGYRAAMIQLRAKASSTLPHQTRCTIIKDTTFASTLY